MNTKDTADAAADSFSETSTQTSPTADTPKASFGELSKRIRSRTTDLLAVAIVLVGGLTLGTRIVRWWSTDESELALQPSPPANVSWGAGHSPVSLEFGEGPIQLERQTASGDRQAVISQLVDRCAAVARETRSVTANMLPAEQNLLKQLERFAPVREEPGRWQVYFVELPLGLVVATRTIAKDQRPVENSAKAPVSQPATDRPARRVVCWGLAQPARKGEWVLFLMRPTAGEVEQRPQIGRVALPEGSSRILSLRDATGGALLAFEGDAAGEEWIDWFDNWFAGHKWKAARDWSRSPNGWSATYVPRDEDESGRIDISFSRSDEGRMSGIVSIATTARETDKGSKR